MGGSYSRRKGHNFERWVAAQFREHGFPDAKRGQQTRFGSDAPDVDGTPYWIECKVGKRVYPIRAFFQAQDARTLSRVNGNRPIIVVTKLDRQAAIAHVATGSYLVDMVPFLATAPVTTDLRFCMFSVPLLELLPKLPKEL